MVIVVLDQDLIRYFKERVKLSNYGEIMKPEGRTEKNLTSKM